jgi:hypothetical protein
MHAQQKKPAQRLFHGLSGRDAAPVLMINSLFDGYNRKYFAGKLPHTLILSSRFGDGYTCHGKQQIFINSLMNRARIRKVLIHEMAHASVSEPHTQKWLKDMQRLRKLGAPVDLNREKELVGCEEINVEMEREERGSSFLIPPPCCRKCKSEYRRRTGVGWNR